MVEHNNMPPRSQTQSQPECSDPPQLSLTSDPTQHGPTEPQRAKTRDRTKNRSQRLGVRKRLQMKQGKLLNALLRKPLHKYIQKNPRTTLPVLLLTTVVQDVLHSKNRANKKTRAQLVQAAVADDLDGVRAVLRGAFGERFYVSLDVCCGVIAFVKHQKGNVFCEILAPYDDEHLENPADDDSDSGSSCCGGKDTGDDSESEYECPDNSDSQAEDSELDDDDDDDDDEDDEDDDDDDDDE